MATDSTALDLLPRIYEAAIQPEAWDPLLEDLARRMGGTTPGMFLVSQDPDASLLERTPSLDPAWRRAYNDHYHRLDVRRNALQRQREGTVVAGHALVPNRVLVRSAFYNDFLRPQGFFHIALALPIRSRGRVAAVRVIRPRNSPPFEEKELKLLRTLVPHFRSALDLHCQLAEARRVSSGMSSALSSLGVGAIGLDASGRVVFANAEAERLLALADGLRLDGGRLRADSPREDVALERLAASSSGGGALTITRPSRRPPFEARVIPLPAAGGDLGVSAAAALVFIREHDQTPMSLDPDALREFYGFTPAELRVAVLLAEGKSGPAIARALGVSIETVRTHRKRLFEKTGAHGQAQFVRMLTASLAALRPPS